MDNGSWTSQARATGSGELDRQIHRGCHSPPVGNGNVVTWTERLTPRAVRSADPWSKIMTVEVSAVVRDGPIAYLSAPFRRSR